MHLYIYFKVSMLRDVFATTGHLSSSFISDFAAGSLLYRSYHDILVMPFNYIFSSYHLLFQNINCLFTTIPIT